MRLVCRASWERDSFRGAHGMARTVGVAEARGWVFVLMQLAIWMCGPLSNGFL